MLRPKQESRVLIHLIRSAAHGCFRPCDTTTRTRRFCDAATHPPSRHVLLSARDGHHEMFGLGANGARVHSAHTAAVSHMAKINNQRMEWGIMIAAINATATNS